MKKMVHESGAKIRIVNPETPHPTVHVVGSQKEVELGLDAIPARDRRLMSRIRETLSRGMIQFTFLPSPQQCPPPMVLLLILL